MFEETYEASYSLYLLPTISLNTPKQCKLQNGDFVLQTPLRSNYRPLYQVKKDTLVRLGHLEDAALIQATNNGATSLKTLLAQRASPTQPFCKTVTKHACLNISSPELEQLIAACRTPSPPQAIPPISPTYKEFRKNNNSSLTLFSSTITAAPKHTLTCQQKTNTSPNKDDLGLEFKFDDLFQTNTPPPTTSKR